MATTNKKSRSSISSIELVGAAKFFNGRAVFQNMHVTLQKGEAWSITGPNGSGKSTLIKVLGGFTGLSEGKIHWQAHDHPVVNADIYQYCSLAAPYLELFESFTLEENIRFYGSLKGFRHDMGDSDVMEFIGLKHAANKPIRDFSSGMKQRTKLGLAYCADTDILLLDEPLTNLDSKGYEWYRNIPDDYIKSRIVVVGSNLEGDETWFCSHRISMTIPG
ncbi:MAG: ABC transporter ATP-binding protein [Bacteroidia bacterium]